LVRDAKLKHIESAHQTQVVEWSRYALKRKIKPIASAVVNHIKLFLIGICIVGLVALLSGCASAPICPEVKVTFCPTE